MDVIGRFTDALIKCAAGLAPQTIQFWLRMVCLLVFPLAASAWTLHRGHRSVLVQVGAGLAGVLLALSLPLQQIRIDSGLARLWLLSAAILLTIFIPIILPGLLLPTLGAQQRLRKTLIFIVAALVFSNLLWG